jgi:hypothetical protein
MHARALTEAVETHSGVVAAVTDLKLRQQAAVLKSARAIGLTTTRAAMQRALLGQLSPGVVIVEEVKHTYIDTLCVIHANKFYAAVQGVLMKAYCLRLLHVVGIVSSCKCCQCSCLRPPCNSVWQSVAQ